MEHKMDDRSQHFFIYVIVRSLYFLLGLLLPLAVFALPLFRPITPGGQVALFFVASVLAGLVPAIGSRNPGHRFRVIDPAILFAMYALVIGVVYLLEPTTILMALEGVVRIDILEYRKIFWIEAIPYALAMRGIVGMIETTGLAIGMKRRRFIIRKAAAHENMAAILQEVREKAGKPSHLSEFFYKKLMSRCLVFLGERFDIVHYSISAFTLSQNNAVYFFDFLDAEEDQSVWPRKISAEQFLHNLWQTEVFRGKSLYYVQRPGEMDFAARMDASDETRALSPDEAADIVGQLNARYPLLEVSIPSVRDIPQTLQDDCRVLELLPAPGNRDHGSI
ncbi:MAG: hypothetical protein KDK23_01395 [Leptospiraceae bacterium]|nr:hypothetical protein [Leptospiraceae bacterium]